MKSNRQNSSSNTVYSEPQYGNDGKHTIGTKQNATTIWKAIGKKTMGDTQQEKTDERYIVSIIPGGPWDDWKMVVKTNTAHRKQ